jgi:hypothetical protein
MYYTYKLFLIFLLLLFITLSIKYNIIEHFNDNIHLNLPIDLGNQLCVYFFNIGYSFLKNEPFIYNDHSEIYFMKDLPRHIDIDENIRNQLLENNFTIDELNKENELTTHLGTWFILHERREIYWNILKPLVHKILDETFIKCNLKKNINEIVIHYRCSDVPFIRHFQYHFIRYSFYTKALESVKDLNINDIKLISCTSHHSGGEYSEKCSIYADSLSNYISTFRYNIKKECNTMLDDFATMFYAPVVICGPSSFSFMSAFFGDGKYISDTHYDANVNKNCNTCKNTWLNNKEYIIKHHEIADYFNIDNVIKILKS